MNVIAFKAYFHMIVGDHYRKKRKVSDPCELRVS